jgi:hypothetical protein
MIDDDSVLTVEEHERLIREILSAAPDQCMDKRELLKAIDRVIDLRISAAMLRLWETGEMTFGWDEDAQQLVLQGKDRQ